MVLVHANGEAEISQLTQLATCVGASIFSHQGLHFSKLQDFFELLHAGLVHLVAGFCNIIYFKHHEAACPLGLSRSVLWVRQGENTTIIRVQPVPKVFGGYFHKCPSPP